MGRFYGGRCFSDGTLTNQGSDAYYWSSTDGDSSRAYSLYYYYGSLGVSIYNEDSGFQVRCVK